MSRCGDGPHSRHKDSAASTRTVQQVQRQPEALPGRTGTKNLISYFIRCCQIGQCMSLSVGVSLCGQMIGCNVYLTSCWARPLVLKQGLVWQGGSSVV